MEKAHLVAQPFQLIARQRREACRLSGSGGRGNERGLLTMVMPSPPKGGHLVLVPLCTAMVMAWPLQGELRFPLATFHYHSLPPAS